MFMFLVYTVLIIKMRQGSIIIEGRSQGVKARMLGRQNDRNKSYVSLAHTSIFGLFFYVSLPNEIKLLLFNIFFFGQFT